MASKMEKLRAAATRARKVAKDRETLATFVEPAAGATYGYLAKEGIYLPSIPKVGRHATTGALMLLVGANTTGKVSEIAQAFGRAGLVLAAYEMATKGSTVAGDDYDDDEDVSGIEDIG